jgi:4-amino-4-deoxy-L-arabinose transferase-like glycosyltransferase
VRIHIFCVITIILFGLVTTFVFWGIPLVPFHPDESTQLFLSSDFDEYLSNPLKMSWDRGGESDPRQKYRELDAPLTRYILGLGRSFFGMPALPVDWDWSKSWAQNQQAGAVPDPDLLYIGRFFITILIPISIILIYSAGHNIGNRYVALIASILFSTNALILLHDRRAMAESALTLGTILVMIGLFQAERHPWITGLSTALAFNAKQSAIALVPVGILAVVWQVGINKSSIRKNLTNLLQFVILFALISFILNPLYWKHPWSAIEASWTQRQVLLRRQIADSELYAPNQFLNSPGKRLIALSANLFVIPPSFAEVGNYSNNTEISEQTYMGVFGHNLLRGLIPGGIMLALTLSGILCGISLIRKKTDAKRKNITLLLLATVSQFIALMIWVPLPWQRYAIPLVPFICLWQALALAKLIPQKVLTQ